MNIRELVQNNKEALRYLNDFFRHPLFLVVKDAFVAHTPGGEGRNGVSDKTTIEVAHGKNLGTRYVFNEIEEIAVNPPVEKSRQAKQHGGKDPDLAT